MRTIGHFIGGKEGKGTPGRFGDGVMNCSMPMQSRF